MEMVSIPLSDTLREHMQNRVASGDFKDEGDYLRRLIAIDLERLEALRAAIQDGIDSGISDRSIDQILEDVKREYFASHPQ